MKLFLLIYLSGSFISVLLSYILFKCKEKKLDEIFQKTEDDMSEKFNMYDSKKYMNFDAIFVTNFLMSWIIVVIFLYAYIEKFFYWLIKIFKN